MNNKIEGIVIYRQDYKDNDAILHIISSEYGKFSLVAKGIKKTTSKNAAGCNLFSCSVFTCNYQEKNTLHTLRTAEKKQLFHHIYDDLLSQSVAQCICEAVDKIECDHYEYIYDVLYHSLLALHEKKNPFLVLGFVLAKLNMMSGVSPSVEGCVRCGNTDSIVSISIQDGGFVCANCFDAYQLKSKELTQLQFFRLLHKAEVEDLAVLYDWKEAQYEDIESIVDMFLEHSGIALKSISFLHKIRELQNP